MGDAVRHAIDVGYRHIDCAHVYENEKEVGIALREKLCDGSVHRNEVYITSKLWNTFHRPDLVIPALQQTLSDLQLEYLDLYLIHWPMAFKEESGLFPEDNGRTLYSDVDYVCTWKAMEEAVRKGMVKSIGVSNFNKAQLERVLSCAEIKPVTNQVECHPYLNQAKLIEYCKSKNIVVTAYSPLGSPDRPWAKPEDPLLMEDKKLQEVANKYCKSPAQILIRYQIQRGNIVIPKSVTKKRILENSEIFDFELSEEDVTYIDTFDNSGRFCHLNWVKDHKDYPFNDPF